MTVSMEARAALNMFQILQKIDLIDKAEEMDIFYIWMQEVEYYADKHAEFKRV